MFISSLSLDNFRNFEKEELTFSPETNIFYGDNGSGKTSLLEAIFTLCLGRSHRGASDVALVRHEQSVYRLEGEISKEEKNIGVTVAFQKSERKKITIDKVTVRIHELYDNFQVVSAGPEDSEIISGGPTYRRTFLDMYISQLSKRYLDDLSQYQKVIAQKNAALKNQINHSPFNILMADYGSRIIFERLNFITKLNEITTNHNRHISGDGELLIDYKPSLKITDDHIESIEKIKEFYEEELNRIYQREEIMQSSLLGPHRDDLFFELNGYPAKQHGSQGECRTAAISLKLAVYQILKDAKENAPILLLDEIFAELDPTRANSLIETFGKLGQVFVTSAQKPPDSLWENSRNFCISNSKAVLS